MELKGPRFLVLSARGRTFLTDLFFRSGKLRADEAAIRNASFDCNNMRLIATGRYVRLARKEWSARSTGWGRKAASRPTGKGQQCRAQSTSTQSFPQASISVLMSDPATSNAGSLEIDGRTYPTDEWTNVPATIISAIPRRLHLQPDHPISITRQIIESRFPAPVYKHHTTFSPVVTVAQNFDSLGFPADHPGRSRTDTYYINQTTVLRTHTSAHQADTFRANQSEGYTISADVYRRDAIDRSHYPIFHQMEGARMWDRAKVPRGDIATAIRAELSQLPPPPLSVSDPPPSSDPSRSPLQTGHHSADEAAAIAAHLKRTLELVVAEIFSRARRAAGAAAAAPVQVRWVEASFPFTSPSWELEVRWHGAWLELLGCGVVQQDLFRNAGVPSQVGWAFGVGLERVAMLLFSIPDIRLFWSRDGRFLSQFSAAGGGVGRFVPFSRFPACYKDVSFWARGAGDSAGGVGAGGAWRVHENDVMEVVREVGGDLVEDVRLVDEFTQPRTGRKSFCYRINYRSLERTLRNEEADGLHGAIRGRLVEKLGVELR